MNCLVCIEGRFVLREGKPASHHLSYDRFWRRYLDSFDSLIVVGRLFLVEDPDASAVEGPGICFWPLPGYEGPEQYLRNVANLRHRIRSVTEEPSAVILRVPGAIGGLVWREIRGHGRPYAVEVVGDPYDVFAPGSFRHCFRPLLRWWFSRELRRQCAGACAASYVTEQALQRRYPAGPGAFVTHYSSVELPDTAFALGSRRFGGGTRQSFTVVFVGTLARLYKGPDVLIDAVTICLRDGLDIRLVVVGDGRYRPELEAKAAALGLLERVDFVGQLPAGEAVRRKLDEADLFVLPSRQEGLPRAMIEAMARGLPCIGSTVGGIPEVLPSEDLVSPGDPVALACKIREVVTDPVRMARMSARNLEKAKEYGKEILRQRRVEFYQYVRAVTEAWIRSRER